MKALCIPYSHTFSHLARPLAVGIELKARGHEVAFAGTSSKLRHAAEAGFAVYDLFEPAPDVLYGNIRAGRLRFVSREDIERMVEADLDLIRAVRPDVVLTDGRFSAQVSCQVAGVPHAAIVNVSSTAYRALPYIPMFDAVPRWLAPPGSAVRSALDRVNLRLEMAVFDAVMNVFSQLTRKHGLRRKVTATNCLAGADLTLLADVPEYFPARDMPPDHQYVGPLTWSLRLPAPEGWPPPRRRGPCVYVTMGTTGIPEFFPLFVDLLARSGMDAVVTTGGQAPGLASPDPHIWVGDFVDGSLAMPLCDVVVCHGGNGTIYQALQHGKPVIGMPSIPDQAFNMRRVEALGLGRTVSWTEFEKNPSVLLDVVRDVLGDPSFTEAAVRMQAVLAAYHAPARCADLLHELVRPF
jgi:UDP:flavonoid glycosyltransferase YjiC (YdhE family)